MSVLSTPDMENGFNHLATYTGWWQNDTEMV